MVGLRPQNYIKIESENVLTWLYTLLCFYNFELDFLIILSAATHNVHFPDEMGDFAHFLQIVLHPVYHLLCPFS